VLAGRGFSLTGLLGVGGLIILGSFDLTRAGFFALDNFAFITAMINA
jgi:hypothetical protein